MKVFKTKPLPSLSFQDFFEKVFFWKDPNDPLIDRLTDICMFGFNYESKVTKGKSTFISTVNLEEFFESLPADSQRTKLQRILDWYNRFDKTINYVKIDDHDLWNLDNTLADIIKPALIKLKETNEGYPLVDDEDVPEELRTNSENPEENYSVAKWNYVLDEMIHSFCPKALEEAFADEVLTNRLKNGTRLFGKYYFSLWT